MMSAARRVCLAFAITGGVRNVHAAPSTPAEDDATTSAGDASDDDANDDDDASEEESRVIVVPTRPREATATRVRAEEAQRVPGSSGDAVRVVENLPGVGRASAGSGQLVIWGAPPQDTRIYVDGVPVPRLYHEGGLRSVVQPKLVDTIDLVAGGQGVMWGRGLAGIVSVTTTTPEGDRPSGRLGADLLDASALVATPLDRRRKVHLAVGVRASYVALWAREIIDDETAGLVPLPSYGDGQARVLWRPSSRDSLEVVTIVSSDRFRRGVPDRDPALAVTDRRATDFGRIYARWIHQPRENVRLVVTPFVGLGRSARTTRVGVAATSNDASDVLVGVRASSAWRPRDWLQLDIGLDAEVDTTRTTRVGSLGLPAREGDIRVFGQPPPDDLSADGWRATRVGIAPFVQAELAPWRGALRIIPGLRIDPYARAVDRRTPPSAVTPKVGVTDQDFSFEPRLAIVGTPADRLELRAATGLYRQAPSPDDLSAAFGTPDLPTSKAMHALVGAKMLITRALSIDVSGFFSRSQRLAMRSSDASPLPAHALRASGTGRTWGMQVLLRQELWKGLFGWVAYTLMRAERRDRPGEAYRLSDFDQTHVLTGLLAWSLPRGFSIGARMRYATGFPRTPVIDAWFDTARNRYQPELGAHNSIRVPQFAQLDARLAKQWDVRGTSIEAFVEVLNVWNRRNAEEIVYTPDYSRRGTISGFPILPAGGVQWDF